MADDRKKGRGEPAVEFRWDPLQLASDQTFSTTVRIYVSGWWPEGRPTEVSLSYYEKSQKPADGDLVRIQKGQGTFPLTGLEPGKHYHVVVYIEDRTPVHEIIMVPELPKPKSPEQEALENERTKLERAKVARQLKQEKKEDKEPTPIEQKVAGIKLQTEQIKADHEFKEVEKKFGALQPKRKIEVLGTDSRTGVLKMFLCRLGKDGKPEPGAIHAFDGGPLSWTMKQGEEHIVASLPLRDRPRKVTFLLPDDREVRVTVDVPVKPFEKTVETETAKPSASQRILEAFQRGCRGELLAAKDPAKVLPLAAVAVGVLATVLAFKGPEGPGGK